MCHCPASCTLVETRMQRAVAWHLPLIRVVLGRTDQNTLPITLFVERSNLHETSTMQSPSKWCEHAVVHLLFLAWGASSCADPTQPHAHANTHAQSRNHTRTRAQAHTIARNLSSIKGSGSQQSGGSNAPPPSNNTGTLKTIRFVGCVIVSLPLCVM